MLADDDISKGRTLVEALPYIKRFADKTLVVKYGGSLISNEDKLTSLAKDMALLRYIGAKPVVVHGGGQEIEKWLTRFGKKQKIVEGQHFADSESLQIIDMVLCGNISNAIVTSLSQAGVRAVGLSGRDADLFTTRRIRSPKKKDLGYVGEIEPTDVSLLINLVTQGYVPVISSIGFSRDGSALNVDSDLVAASIAAALKATKLIYLSASTGVKRRGKLIELLDLPEAENLLSTDEVEDGTRLKLSAGIEAIKGGVTDVHIISGSIEHSVLLELLTDKGVGSMITNQKMRI